MNIQEWYSSLMLRRISSLTNNNFYITLLCVYFLSISFLPIIGYIQVDNVQLFTIWNTLSLAIVFVIILLTHRTGLVSKKFLGIVFIYLLSIMLTIISSIIHNNTKIYTVSTEMVAPIIYLLALLVIMGGYRMSNKQLSSLNIFYICFSVFAVVYNIIINYEHLQLLTSGVYNSETLSMSAFFTNRNTYGLMVALGALVATFQGIMTKYRSKKFLYALLALVLAVATFSSMSRGAILFMVVSIGFLYAAIKGLRGLFTTVFVFGVASCILISLLGLTQFNDLIVRPSSGLTGRDIIYSYGIDRYWSNDIIFGTGPQVSNEAVVSDMGVVSYHNTYITYLVSGGLFLLSVALTIFTVSFKTANTIRKSSKGPGIFFLAILVSYLIYGFFESNPLFIFSPNSFILSLYAVALPVYYYNHTIFESEKLKAETKIGKVAK